MYTNNGRKSNLDALIGIFSSEKRIVSKKVIGNATEWWCCNKCAYEKMFPRRVYVDDKTGVNVLEPIVCPHCGANEVNDGEEAFTWQKAYGDDE